VTCDAELLISPDAVSKRWGNSEQITGHYSEVVKKERSKWVGSRPRLRESRDPARNP
jgi:hypothetical protein